MQVADGQAMDHVDFALPRMGVISGRVTDEVGEPIAGVSVWAFQSRVLSGPPAARAQLWRRADRRHGAVSPARPAARRLRDSSEHPPETWIMDGEEKQTLAFAPTFFPGMTTASDAQRVRVAVRTRGHRHRFRAHARAGGESQRLRHDVTGRPARRREHQHHSRDNRAEHVEHVELWWLEDSRRWQLHNQGPAARRLQARGAPARAEEDRPGEFAMVPITLTGADIEGILLTRAQAGISLEA